MEKFESDRGLSAEQQKKVAEYFESIYNRKQEKKKFVNADLLHLYYAFKSYYADSERVLFNPEANNGQSKLLVFTLLSYLFKNQKFFDSPLLDKSRNEPSLNKGLMIVGGYGVGKTSTMKALRLMLTEAYKKNIKTLDIHSNKQKIKHYKPLFGFSTANDIVSEYETLQTSSEKEQFWKQYTRGMRYIDDLMTEREASNYGKVNLFKELLEKMVINNAKPIISLNYVGEGLDDTLEAYGQKYGSRNYDRIFSLFNIITLKGKSLRK